MRQVLLPVHPVEDCDSCQQHVFQDWKALSSGGRTLALFTDSVMEKEGGWAHGLVCAGADEGWGGGTWWGVQWQGASDSAWHQFSRTWVQEGIFLLEVGDGPEPGQPGSLPGTKVQLSTAQHVLTPLVNLYNRAHGTRKHWHLLGQPQTNRFSKKNSGGCALWQGTWNKLC